MKINPKPIFTTLLFNFLIGFCTFPFRTAKKLDCFWFFSLPMPPATPGFGKSMPGLGSIDFLIISLLFPHFFLTFPIFFLPVNTGAPAAHPLAAPLAARAARNELPGGMLQCDQGPNI